MFGGRKEKRNDLTSNPEKKSDALMSEKQIFVLSEIWLR